MASASAETAGRNPAGALLLAAVAEQGSAAHSWPRHPELLQGPTSARSLADLIHFLCVLHGRYPGVVDHAAGRVVETDARAWLASAAAAFAQERGCLARLAVAAGPMPSTPGAADSDAAVLGQRHAIEMLAQSERKGCALGAAMAVILDWTAFRPALDAAARRFGVDVPGFAGADPAAIARLADSFATTASVQRALLFGAQQILVQHYGLCDLLESRHQARA
jgi:uncharacterized protein DUF6975